MSKDISPEEMFSFNKKVLVDIRSPAEYDDFHIPGAVNIPLFDNEEKALIGYIYRTSGMEKARRLGEKIAEEKIGRIYSELRSLKEKYENVIIYCWRGGLRSLKLCEVMERMGLTLYRLKGGYRAYRQFILSDMKKILSSITFVVLTGKTGVGKTKILRELKKRKLPVIDLEELAGDRGSVFGNLGRSRKLSQKMFDALLYEEIKNYKSGVVFTEDESKRIGRIHLPEAFWNRKEKGLYIEITASLNTRIENILEEYTSFQGWEEYVEKALFKIAKYLGTERFKYLKKLLRDKEYKKAVHFLIVEYYDKKYKLTGKPSLKINADNLQECVSKLEEFYISLKDESEIPNPSIQGR